MPIDLTKKRIILIHGLASKPPEAAWFELWSQCLIENIAVDDKALAKAMRSAPGVLQSAYWANAVPHHIEDDAAYVRKLRKQVDRVIAERRKRGDGFHVSSLTDKFKSFFKGRALDVVSVLSNALTIKDNVAKAYLREVELYSEDQYIADRIRKPLEDRLRDAWDHDCDVAVVSHSMGTLVAYDVLWRFAHRAPKVYRKYRRKRVRMFVTTGSPLGDSVIRGLLFARHHEGTGKREFPMNIDFWHNYACLGDIVSHDASFEDDYFEPMRQSGALPDRPKHRAIDYKKLHNPFEVVTHSGNRKKPKRNPHKSYGYLIQPRLGTWIVDFLRDRLR